MDEFREGRWHGRLAARAAIPPYDAYKDPMCPWGMAAVFNAQLRAKRAKRKEVGLLKHHGRHLSRHRPFVEPGVPVEGPGLPPVVANKTYGSELELVELAATRDALLTERPPNIESLREVTIALGLALRKRRVVLGAPKAWSLEGAYYAIATLGDTDFLRDVPGLDFRPGRNPLMLAEPHPALAEGALDADVDTLVKRRKDGSYRVPDYVHPYYGAASDAELAIVMELRAMPRDAVVAYDASRRALLGLDPFVPPTPVRDDWRDAVARHGPALRRDLDAFDKCRRRQARADARLADAVSRLAKVRRAMARPVLTLAGEVRQARLRAQADDLDAERRKQRRFIFLDTLEEKRIRAKCDRVLATMLPKSSSSSSRATTSGVASSTTAATSSTRNQEPKEGASEEPPSRPFEAEQSHAERRRAAFLFLCHRGHQAATLRTLQAHAKRAAALTELRARSGLARRDVLRQTR